MDKKTKFTPPSGNKGAAADSKKGQDVNTKVFPKTSKRREPTGANGYPKNEQVRKASVQKTRNFDKRPKPKGQYYGGAKENSKVENDEIAELGSVMVPGSKKQNLNHLLNFHYEPREVRGGNSANWSYGRSSKNYNHTNRWLPPVQRHRYNKEQFLQANCQFVVNKDGDYRVCLVDPDTLVDWKLIEQIRVHTSENLACPICLGSPIAGRMTRCGHVYCWPCILHYLSLSDKTWRKCPICYESVHKNDLKSVTELTQINMKIGDTVTLRLMRRKRGSLLAVPVAENETPDPDTFFTMSEDPLNQLYSKLLLANASDVLEIIGNEKKQLETALMEDPECPENCFIQQALEELGVRKENVLKQDTKINLGKIEMKEDKPDLVETLDKNSETAAERNVIDENTQETTDEIDNLNDSICEEDKSLNISQNTGQTCSKFFYFYQAEDGQNVYLHAMNIKMLELQYGSLENCPRTIHGKLVEKESGSYTEDLRKRLRYLCHLPLTCVFEIAEIKLEPPLISPEILEVFNEQIVAREKRRKRRDREERQREKKINAEENKRLGKYPVRDVHIESWKHFPQWQSEAQTPSVAIPSPPESVSTSSVASSPARSTFDDETSLKDFPSWSSPQNQDQGPSFAQMLRNEGSKMSSSKTWPSISALGAAKKPEINARTGQQSSTPPEDEDEFAAPSYSQSLGDVLAQALEQTELLELSSNAGKSKKTKKKKRGKATVLFATGMSRAS